MLTHDLGGFSPQGKSIECVNACCIIDGQDDSFGEDDHMTHHYSTQTWCADASFLHRSIRPAGLTILEATSKLLEATLYMRGLGTPRRTSGARRSWRI